MSIILGSRIEGAPRPSFHASLDGEAAVVELDSSAVLKLSEPAGIAKLNAILDDKRDRISDAATRLARDGFASRGSNGIEIVVTALDL
jgi:hypothetical protein